MCRDCWFVSFQQGLADLDTVDPRDKHLIILDDLMDETDQWVALLSTKKSHHRNISVVYIVQNLSSRKTPYSPGKPDGLNIMLSKQKGIYNFRLRPFVEENLQTCAR
jgi:hypothetical protein